MFELSIPPGAINGSDPIGELKCLAAAVFTRYRSQLRELSIEVIAGGVILRGRSATFYGKQLAQHEVLRRGLVVVANDIVVATSLCTAVTA
jgi:hypothetical protein